MILAKVYLSISPGGHKKGKHFFSDILMSASRYQDSLTETGLPNKERPSMCSR